MTCVALSLQRHCRGFIQRSRFQTRMSSVITLQAGVRKMIALRRYNRMKIEVSAHREPPHTALQLSKFCDLVIFCFVLFCVCFFLV